MSNCSGCGKHQGYTTSDCFCGTCKEKYEFVTTFDSIVHEREEKDRLIIELKAEVAQVTDECNKRDITIKELCEKRDLIIGELKAKLLQWDNDHE